MNTSKIYTAEKALFYSEEINAWMIKKNNSFAGWLLLPVEDTPPREISEADIIPCL